MSKLVKFDSLRNTRNSKISGQFEHSSNSLDYEKLGMKCGLEIHQQLNTGKLFCSCPCEVVPNDTLTKQIERKLRFSLGESGEIDKAALNEFKKGKFNVYKYNDEVACLVDLDEEPPKGPNQLALDTVIKMGEMLDVVFFDKLQFMRKLIIDGSVTSGFQRTAIVGVDGSLRTSFGDVKIEGINLEEDSCRTIAREDGHTVFALDRQGIPLIEITTGPQIKRPEQAYETAKQLGNILRSFSEVRRGLGTIRQDLNVSITGGARVEIKGTQNLKLMAGIVENEVKRQIVYKSILDELKHRGVDSSNFSDMRIYDVSRVFENCDSNVIKENLGGTKRGVFAIKLVKFKGILGHEMQENYRFATEISDRNKSHFPTIKGLFHSDELPKYGITDEEVDSVRKELGLEEDDSFILIANDSDVARKSLKYVLEIVQELISGVLTEVRQVDPKGVVTKFSRPMPGGARMYPETDVPDVVLSEEYLKEMREKIPELYDDKLNRLSKDFKLDSGKVVEVLDSFSEEEVKKLIGISGKTASFVYAILFEIPKDIRKREGVEVPDFRYELLCDVLREASENDFNQKVIRDIFVSLAKDKLVEVSNLKEYLDEKGLIGEQVDEEEIEKRVKEVIDANSGAPFGALMGLCMKEFGGSVDGKKISEVLRKLM